MIGTVGSRTDIHTSTWELIEKKILLLLAVDGVCGLVRGHTIMLVWLVMVLGCICTRHKRG
jgi:hypothetical protein